MASVASAAGATSGYSRSALVVTDDAQLRVPHRHCGCSVTSVAGAASSDSRSALVVTMAPSSRATSASLTSRMSRAATAAGTARPPTSTTYTICTVPAADCTV